MKVTDWRRKLAASLVAGGLFVPVAAPAANLNSNLLTNPSFEDVGGLTCCYSASEILDWNDGSQMGFAYHSGQGYDAGGPLAGGGDYYFSPNADNGIADITDPGQVAQNADVSTGDTATLIDAGEAALKLSAFFTSYSADNDLGNLHVEFLNSGGNSLGSTQISARSPVEGWHQVNGVDFIPVGTSTLRTSVFGTPVTFGPDGYIDLVDVQVTEAANELLYLQVDITTGDVSIHNQTGDAFHIDYYEISAPGSADGDYNDDGSANAADYVVWRNNLGDDVTLPNDTTPGSVTEEDYDVWVANFGGGANSLNSTQWNSLQEQDLAGFPAGDGSGNGWEQAGGSSSSILSESYLTGNSELAHGASVSLGAAFNMGSPENLEFRYGRVADDGMGQFEGPGMLVRGFVRYVTSDGSSAAVPEPTSICLVGIGLLSLTLGGRRSARDHTLMS